MSTPIVSVWKNEVMSDLYAIDQFMSTFSPSTAKLKDLRDAESKLVNAAAMFTEKSELVTKWFAGKGITEISVNLWDGKAAKEKTLSVSEFITLIPSVTGMFLSVLELDRNEKAFLNLARGKREPACPQDSRR